MKKLLIAVLALLTTPAYGQNKANPDISLNTLLIHRSGTEGNASDAENTNGFALQEAELRLTSNIDTYFRGDVILALEQEEPETPGEEAHYALHPEEVFVETLSLPGFTVRAGKFYPFWGRSNQWHTHSLPFVDPFQTREAVFGHEGFNEVGVAVSYLAPTPWYLEVVAQGFSASNEAVFGSESNDDLAGVLFVKSLWDLDESATLELDLGLASGDDITNERNNLYNLALTYKNPLDRARSLVATTEYTQAEKLYDDTPANQGRTSVLSSWVQYQWAARWWVQARYEMISNITDDDVDDISKVSGLLGFVPSEFSALRLQVDDIDDPATEDNEQIVTLQLNLTMGAHPAHSY